MWVSKRKLQLAVYFPNLSYSGAPLVLEIPMIYRTHFWKCYFRLGGHEMASLLEKECLRDCNLNNLTLSFESLRTGTPCYSAAKLCTWTHLSLRYKIQRNYIQLKITWTIWANGSLKGDPIDNNYLTENNSVCMLLGQILDQKIKKRPKRKKSPISIPEEPWAMGVRSKSMHSTPQGEGGQTPKPSLQPDPRTYPYPFLV